MRVWGLGFEDVTPIMKNHMEKKMENYMKNGMIYWFMGLGSPVTDGDFRK